MEKFELFMGCFGNGTTVCNKAVENFGDYLQVAHISDSGKIYWYVPVSAIPKDALLKIQNYANKQKEKFWNHFKKWPITTQYGYLLDRVKVSTMLEVFRMTDKTLPEKVEYLKKFADI